MLNLFKTERFYLLYPLSFVGGAACYFGLPREPLPACVLSLALCLTALLFLCEKGRAVIAIFLAFAVGFGYAAWRAKAADHYVLDTSVSFIGIRGRVERVVSVRKDGCTVIVGDVKADGNQTVPDKMRLSLRGQKAAYGDMIRGYFNIYPPALPASYDDGGFLISSWFDGIGASGYNVGKIEIEHPANAGGFGFWRSRLINGTFAFIDNHLSDARQKAVAAALVLGDRGLIAEDLRDAYRDSGMAHLLAVSGTHMSLVAAMIFVSVRFLLALFPAIALNYDIKKISAVFAMLGATLYLLVSGMMVPAVRAYITVMIVLFAVLADRKAVSLRNVALAAVIIVLLNPAYVVSASFLMSFMAVVMIVGAYERYETAWLRYCAGKGWGGKLLSFVIAMVLTDITATFATAPLCLYYFNRLPVFGAVANLIAAPLFSLAVMPVLMLAVLFRSPFLLDLAGKGIAAVNAWADYAASWGGIVLSRSMGTGCLIAALAGLLLFLFVKGKMKTAAVLLYAAAMTAVIYAPVPDCIVDGSGKLFAFKDDNDRLRFNQTTAKKKNRVRWAQKAGMDGVMTVDDKAKDRAFFKNICHNGVCFYDGLAVVERGADCSAAGGHNAIAVINTGDSACRLPENTAVVGKRDLLLYGTHSFYINSDKTVKVKTARDRIGCRRWTYPWCVPAK